MSKKNPKQGAEAATEAASQVAPGAATKASALDSTTPAGANDAARGRLALDMSVNVAGIHLKNPILAASGTFGYGIEFEDIVSLEKLGGFVAKGLSREPMAGNPPPRLFETAAGMLNAIGLQNIGARAFIEEKMPKLAAKNNVVVLANVFGYSREDYVETIHILNQAEGIAAYELNVSCPNTHDGGMVFGTNRTMLEELVATC